jgi:hypothetical protein
MAISNLIIDDLRAKFGEVRRESEAAIAQLDSEKIRKSLDGDVNSVAVIMKHVGGNLRSRFTNFLHEDGEKAWRDREAEFVDDLPEGLAGREAILIRWYEGWNALESTLESLSDADLATIVRIRGVEHTVMKALARSLSHVSYHQGQITLIARMLVGRTDWKSISIPRGGTAQRHRELGFDPDAG